MREIILDTETTGLNYRDGDRIIEVGCVELINHIDSNNHLQFYCSTDKIITKEAKSIHGLSRDFLSKFPSFSNQAQQFLDFIKNDTLIIHNAEFDLGFLNNELKLAGKEPLKNKVIDTVYLARQTLGTRTVNLDYLCKKFSIDLSVRKFHGALKDCLLLSEVYIELLGGRQTFMNLSKPQTNNTADRRNQQASHKIHKISITSEETNDHKNFSKKMKNSLWNKITY